MSRFVAPPRCVTLIFCRTTSSGNTSHSTLIPVSFSKSPSRRCWISDSGNLIVAQRSVTPACLRQLNSDGAAVCACAEPSSAATASPPPAAKMSRRVIIAFIAYLLC